MASENLERDQNSAVVLGGITDDASQEIRMIRVDPTTNRVLVSFAGAGGFVELTATGTVNSVNTQFTFTQKPTYIVSDGVFYKQLDNNGNSQWSWNAGTLTATMLIPPNNSIFGIA